MRGVRHLAISIGFIAELTECDPEAVDDLREDYNTVNAVLAANGLPAHHEPLSLPQLDDRTPIVGFPYSCLHELRRVYARHIVDSGLAGFPPGLIVTDDTVVDQVGSEQHHLLWHSDCEGFYVPIDFPEVLFDERLPGAMLGSSQRLQAELRHVAPTLGITLTQTGDLVDAEAARLEALIESDAPLATATMVWFALFEAARLSISHSTAIHFG
jgi:hypothetical protein